MSEMAKQIATNRVLPAVKTALRGARMTLSGLFRLFPSSFKVSRGTVALVNSPTPAPPQERQEPRQETREERNARLDRLLAESRAREEAAQEARAARNGDA